MIRLDAAAPRIDDGLAEPASGTAGADAAFEFVKLLAADVSSGSVELPSFPDVAMRVRKALSDPEVTAATMSRLIATEPALAARVLQLANSAALNVSGRQVTNLQSAVARVGFNVLRVAALSFAVSQLRKQAELVEIAAGLEELWRRSTATAATAYAIARRAGARSPDEALLAGLMCPIGRLYVLSRSTRFGDIRRNPAVYANIVERWHAEVAKAVLESWAMPEAVVQAVHRHPETDYDHEGGPDLSDTLIVANVLVESEFRADALALHLATLPAAMRFAWSAEDWNALLQDAQREVAEIRATLGA